LGKFLEEGIKFFASHQDQLQTIGSQINTTMDSRGLSKCAVSVEIKKGKKVELIGREVNKFKNPEIERQKNELIEEVKGDKNYVEKPEESLNRHFIDSGDSLTFSTERKDKDSAIKESYTESNQKRPKQEISDKDAQQEITETSSNSDKKDKNSEKETKHQDFSQKPDSKDKEEKENKLANNQQNSLSNNKGNNSKGIYYGIGVIGLVSLLLSIF